MAALGALRAWRIDGFDEANKARTGFIFVAQRPYQWIVEARGFRKSGTRPLITLNIFLCGLWFPTLQPLFSVFAWVFFFFEWNRAR